MSIPSLMTPFPLASMPIEVCSWLSPGYPVLYMGRVYVRHLSEILCAIAGATWHVNGHCPTWTEETECRCMVEGS
jgi:hypothetical protein